MHAQCMQRMTRIEVQHRVLRAVYWGCNVVQCFGAGVGYSVLQSVQSMHRSVIHYTIMLLGSVQSGADYQCIVLYCSAMQCKLLYPVQCIMSSSVQCLLLCAVLMHCSTVGYRKVSCSATQIVQCQQRPVQCSALQFIVHQSLCRGVHCVDLQYMPTFLKSSSQK